MMKKILNKKNSKYARLVDFGDVISSRAKGASPKLTTGYTIIETMIAVSLFLVIIMAGMGALLNANLLNQKSRDMRSIMDNLSFVIEDISKNLRIGYNYHCLTTDILPVANLDTPKSCVNGWGIAFESADGSKSNPNDQWIYFIGQYGSTKTRIFKSFKGPALMDNFIPLTPEEVEINDISGFSVMGAESPSGSPADTQQPFVNIRISGTITSKNTVTPFSLQTSISQRAIDI